MQKRDTQLRHLSSSDETNSYGNKAVVPNQRTTGNATKFKTVV